MIAEEQVAGRVFPTHAGMNRAAPHRARSGPGVPRACGGEPPADGEAAMPAAVDDRFMARSGAVSLIATSAMSTSIPARVARHSRSEGRGAMGSGGQARRRPQARPPGPLRGWRSFQPLQRPRAHKILGKIRRRTRYDWRNFLRRGPAAPCSVNAGRSPSKSHSSIR